MTTSWSRRYRYETLVPALLVWAAKLAATMNASPAPRGLAFRLGVFASHLEAVHERYDSEAAYLAAASDE